jgi:hypothetical protein
MRMFSLVLAAAVLALALSQVRAADADAAGVTGEAAVTVSSQQQVDDNDDTRVEVQLVVLGIAAFVVLGIGAAGYVLRKRLGLVPPPPGPDAGGHH